MNRYQSWVSWLAALSLSFCVTGLILPSMVKISLVLAILTLVASRVIAVFDLTFNIEVRDTLIVNAMAVLEEQEKLIKEGNLRLALVMEKVGVHHETVNLIRDLLKEDPKDLTLIKKGDKVST